MNVYDFDHTIYPGDSTIDFWRWCVRRHPGALAALPGAALAGGLYRLGRRSLAQFKGTFYRFLRHVPDARGEAERFWDARIGRIEPWYRAQRRDDDLIISASPAFVVAPACDRLGVRVLASEVDPGTGRLLGPNCRGAEKLTRFRSAFPQGHIHEFYSDSRSDAPLAEAAERAFLVRKGTVTDWR